MNEAETRAELIDPKLRESCCGVVEGTKVLREHHITRGKIEVGGRRAKPYSIILLMLDSVKVNL